MRFSTINDKPIKDGDLGGEIIPTLVEHVFFQFMNHGRDGITSANRDVIDTLISYHFDKQPVAGKIWQDALTSKEYQEVLQYGRQSFVNSVISEGTKGFYRTVGMISTQIYNLMHHGR